MVEDGSTRFRHLRRATLVSHILEYFHEFGADVTPRERMITKFVQSRVGTVDRMIIRETLSGLVVAGVMTRLNLPGRAVLYRLSRRCADPRMEGYAREIDELLTDPILWVTPQGKFFKIGRPHTGSWKRSFLVPTFPHHFGEALWVRAWLHAFNFGLFEVMGRQALDLVCEAVLEAPVHLARKLHHLEGGDEKSQAAAFLSDQPLYHQIRKAPEDIIRKGGPLPGANATVQELGPDALTMLHRLCGHMVLAPDWGRMGINKDALLNVPVWREPQLYFQLDRMVWERIAGKRHDLPPPVRKEISRIFQAVAQQRDEMETVKYDDPHETRTHHTIAPSFRLIEGRLRRLDTNLRRTMHQGRIHELIRTRNIGRGES